MVSDISRMRDSEKLIFMLSGFKCDTLIPKWIPILTNTCSFVYAMYAERKKLYDAM